MKPFVFSLAILICLGLSPAILAQVAGPELISPANGTTDLECPFDFIWSSNPDAYHYSLEIDTVPDFSSPFLLSYGFNDTLWNFQCSNWDNLTLYWRVRAFLLSGPTTDWSETWSFTIFDRRPILQVPNNGQTGVDVPVMIEWTTPVEAEYFFISIDDEPTFTYPYYFNEWVIEDTFFLWNDYFETEKWPTYNKTYYYKIQSQINMERLPWTDTWTFTTVDATPALTAPLEAAVDEPIPVYFEWNCAVDFDYFTISIDDDPGFNPPLVMENYVVYGLSYIWTEADLGTTYYWKVKTYAHYGVSGWSETRSFTTHCPVAEIPELVGPADGSPSLNQPITLDWQGVGGAYSYWLQVSEAPDFTVPVINGQLSWDDRTVHGLTAGTTYYWRVCAVSNVCGWSDWSPVWSFTADADYICGDINNDNGLNILDVTYFIYYLYKSGPPPICW
nr:fibronectin type III domain-containing protein [candidate division Zixibacteria bacterium]